jgi:hypothetical protein
MRRSLSVCVGAGLGAGAASRDLRHLRPRDVTTRPDGSVQVSFTGPSPRIVTVDPRYASILVDGLRGVPANRLLLGTRTDRKGVTTSVIENLDLGPMATVPDQARFRSTWLLGQMLEARPLAEMLLDAGLNTTRVFTDLLPYAQDPDYVGGQR